MKRRAPGTPLRPHSTARRSRLRRPFRAFFETLEDRTMMDSGIGASLPPAIVVGRTLSAYFAGDLQNHQETITFTVYNEQASPVTGVLLTDTLESGETIASASQQPDQSGQNLAWSLGTIQGYDRASVSLTVNLPGALMGAGLQTPPPLDTGAHAYALLDAGAVSNSTPAATFRAGTVSDPALLASTPDANTTDPFIQEEAAKLSYDPQQIFDFLHSQIGYNSYLGSLRGARGTLWSNAGNALDVASLGVALMRASGIPAQYVSGSLSQPQAQQLILSMFPASYQTVGYIPAGTQVSDPANDPQLLSETESHYWFQFDAGNGMTDADPLMAGATVGHTFTAATGTFAAVADALRAKTEITLKAEIYDQAAGVFGGLIGGNGLTTTTVLDKTFNDVDLVGRPLTIGDLVSNSSTGAFSLVRTTNAYTPYIVVGDEALPDAQLPEAITGTPFQEVLTDFPLASQILTGLFLNITLSGPGTGSIAFTRSLVDRIGFAARQGTGVPDIALTRSSDPPILSPFDLTTIDMLSGLQGSGAAGLAAERAGSAIALISSSADASAVAQTAALADVARADLTTFAIASQREAANLATGSSVTSYFATPRVTTFSSHLDFSNNTPRVSFSLDLVNDAMRAVAAPGQNTQAQLSFAAERGMFDSDLEAQVLPTSPQSENLSASMIVSKAMQLGIPLAVITASNLAVLSSFNLPADAIARITQNALNGLTEVVPTQALTLDGAQVSAWYNFNPATGEMIAESQDGSNQGATEYSFWVDKSVSTISIFTENFFGSRYVLIVLPGSIQARLVKAGAAAFSGGLLNLLPNTPPAALAIKIVDLLVFAAFSVLAVVDPTAPQYLISPDVPFPDSGGDTSTTRIIPMPAFPSGSTSVSVRAAGVSVSGGLSVSGLSSTVSRFAVSSLESSTASVLGLAGKPSGSGAVGFSTQGLADLVIAGNVHYTVAGMGNLALYGASTSELDVSGNWQSYTATVTGDVSITLTVPDRALTLDGQALPAGTYTLTAKAATLTGSGTMSLPTFNPSASLTAANGTINLGPGSGTLSVGGKPLDPSNETTLDGYSGTINVSANGDGTDSVALSGNAGNVLQVVVSPSPQPSPAQRRFGFQAAVFPGSGCRSFLIRSFSSVWRL
jgi:hypothetical protein